MLSPIELTKGFLPSMRERGSGTVAFVTSLGGRMVFPFFGAYNSSKHALEGFAEALWHELRPFGIRVKAIEPGYVETPIYDKSKVTDEIEDAGPYAPYQQAMREFSRKVSNKTTPEGAADEVFDVVTDPSERLRYPIAAYARTFVRARRVLGDMQGHALHAQVLDGTLPVGAGRRAPGGDVADRLQDIFDKLKPLVAAYSDRLTARYDEPGRYELWSDKEVEVPKHGRDGTVKKNGLMFASIIIQSSYVGLYFTPIYSDPELGERLDPGLMKTLRGKSCFHIKTRDAEMMSRGRRRPGQGLGYVREARVGLAGAPLWSRCSRGPSHERPAGGQHHRRQHRETRLVGAGGRRWRRCRRCARAEGRERRGHAGDRVRSRCRPTP